MSGWKEVNLKNRIITYIFMIIILYSIICGLVLTVPDEYISCSINQPTNPINTNDLILKNVPCGYKYEWSLADPNTIEFTQITVNCDVPGEIVQRNSDTGVCECAENPNQFTEYRTVNKVPNVYCPCGYVPSDAYVHGTPRDANDPDELEFRVDCMKDTSPQGNCPAGQEFDGLARFLNSGYEDATGKTIHPDQLQDINSNYKGQDYGDTECGCKDMEIVGCMDSYAANYDIDATIQCPTNADGNNCCYYRDAEDLFGPDDCSDCEYACRDTIVGCTVDSYDNYNELANTPCTLDDEDNPNCCFNSDYTKVGCTDPAFANYDASATVSCTNCCYNPPPAENSEVGCMMKNAENYDKAGVESGTITIACDNCCYGCTTQFSTVDDPDNPGASLEYSNYCPDCHVDCGDPYDDDPDKPDCVSCCVPYILGCTERFTIVYDDDAEDGYYAVENINYNPEATYNDGSCEKRVYGCMDESAINYDANANTPNPLNPDRTFTLVTPIDGVAQGTVQGDCQYKGCRNADSAQISVQDAGTTNPSERNGPADKYYYWDKYNVDCNDEIDGDDYTCCVESIPGCVDPAADTISDVYPRADDNPNKYNPNRNQDCSNNFVYDHDNNASTAKVRFPATYAVQNGCCEYRGCLAEFQYLLKSDNGEYKSSATSDEDGWTLIGTAGVTVGADVGTQADCIYAGCLYDKANNYCDMIGCEEDNSVCKIETCTHYKADNRYTFLNDDDEWQDIESKFITAVLNNDDNDLIDDGTCIIRGCFPDDGATDTREVLTEDDIRIKYASNVCDPTLSNTSSDSNRCTDDDEGECNWKGCDETKKLTALPVDKAKTPTCDDCDEHDESMCSYLGCLDDEAFNYKAGATPGNTDARECYGCAVVGDQVKSRGLYPDNWCPTCAEEYQDDLATGGTGEDHSCHEKDGSVRNCCEDFFYGCSDPDAFNYDEDANIDLDPPDTLCENPCDNHHALEDNDMTWYYNRGAFATICTPLTRIDGKDYVMNQLSLHASSKHSGGDFDGMWSANDWEFITGQVESGFKTSIIGMFWVKIYLDDYGDMHTIDGKKKTKSCDDYDSDEKRYKTTVLLLGGEGFGFGNTDKKDDRYCGESNIFTACDKYLNDGDDSTGVIQCADTPYSGYYFAPVPEDGTVPKWEDLGEDDDPSLPVSQITLRTDASGEFQFIYGFRNSYSNNEPKVEINGTISNGRMIIGTIVDKTNGRNSQMFPKCGDDYPEHWGSLNFDCP